MEPRRRSRAEPAPVVGLTDVVEIVAGRYHTCARRLHGEVRCWGQNAFGQLGDGTTTDRATPVEVTLPGHAVALYPGGFRTCAKLADGQAHCWGLDADGTQGSTARCRGWGGSVVCATSPVHVAAFDDAASLSLGRGLPERASSCAVYADGSVRCWSLDTALLGTAVSGGIVNGLGAVAEVAVGEGFICALSRAREVSCWGRNRLGFLGDGTFVDRGDPAPVVRLSDAVALRAGGEHICALDRASAVWCWGSNFDNEIGYASIAQGPVGVPCSAEPAVAGLGRPVVGLAAGGHDTCARTAAGELFCWGEGQATGTAAFNRIEW